MIVVDTYMKARRRQQKRLVHDDGRVSTAEACDRLTEAGRIWRRRREERRKNLEET